MMMVVSDSGKEAGTVRPAAVAGAFYPANAGELQAMIDRQMNHARRLVSSLCLCSMVLRPVERLVFSPKER